MTDKDIIKALECCANATHKDCKNCPLFVVDGCVKTMSINALDLINRQQVEIKRLRKEVNLVSIQFQDLQERYEEAQIEIAQWKEEANKYQGLWCIAIDDVDDIETAQAEAIKEFAERLKEKAHTQPIFDTYCGNKYMGDVSKVYVADIDNLVKEMVGEE